MKKPVEPEKEKLIPESKRLDEYSCDMPLDKFLEWCKDLPEGALNPVVKIKNETDYDYYGNGSSTSYLELHWSRVVSNINYEKELEKYKVKLEKWNKAQSK